MLQPPPQPLTQTPPPVRLTVGLRASEPALIEKLTGRLALEFGAVIDRSERWIERLPEVNPGAAARTLTGDCFRQWISLNEPVDPGHLARLKLHALRVEQLYLDDKARPRVLLDVATVDPTRVTRATPRDAPHRLYLGSGIFGEILLRWGKRGGFEPLPWTLPEHAVTPLLGFFDRVREAWLLTLNRAKTSDHG